MTWEPIWRWKVNVSDADPDENTRGFKRTTFQGKPAIHVVVRWLGDSAKVAIAHYLEVRDKDFAKAAQIAAQQPPESPRKTPHSLADENVNPLVLQETSTKQGGCENPKDTPSGIRTRVSGLRILHPGPLDDGGQR